MHAPSSIPIMLHTIATTTGVNNNR